MLAVSWGKGDPQKDPIYAIFLDDAGHLREHARFDNLMDPAHRLDFSDLISRRKPDVIVVGGFSILATRLMERIREVVGYTEGHQNNALDSQGVDDSNEDRGQNNHPNNLVPVVWMPDQVARIYQHSKRAEEEFSGLPPVGRYCVGLARFAQSPVNEYAALGSDLTAIFYNEDQHLASTTYAYIIKSLIMRPYP